MFWVLTNNKKASLTLDQFAVITNFLYRCAYFHLSYVLDSRLETLDNTTLFLVVGREFDSHPVTNKDFDIMETHFPREVG